MRRTKDEAELTRQALLDGALTVFSRQGYADTRLEDVAKAAGVTRGAIYHHFGGKVELFSALVEDASAVGSSAIQRAIEQGGSFLDITRRVLLFTLQLLASDERFRGVMRLLLFNTGESPELAGFRQVREQQGLAQIEQVAGFFQLGQAQGAVRPDLPPSVAARAFMAYQNGLVLLWLSSPGVIDYEQHAAGLAEVFVRGIQ